MVPKWVGRERIDEGRIVENKTGRLLVVLNPDCVEPASCATCGGATSCAKAAKPAVCTIDIGGRPAIVPGTRIRISHFVFNGALAAFLVFGLPIVFAVLAMVVQQSITGGFGDSVWTIATGGIGFVLGFLVVAVTDRVVKQLTPAPKIVSVIEGRAAPETT